MNIDQLQTEFEELNKKLSYLYKTVIPNLEEQIDGLRETSAMSLSSEQNSNSSVQNYNENKSSVIIESENV